MGEKNGYKFVACKSCGSVLVQPALTQTELDQFFGDIQPDIVHLPNPTAEIMRMKNLIKKIAPSATGKRFLDISCRQGYAVVAAKELGFQQVKGIDSHAFFIDFAKDKYDASLFEHISLPGYALKGQQADVIFSIESLCEQPDLEGYVASLSQILAPGGVIYLHEPDGNSWHLPRTFTRWAFVDPPLNFTYLSEIGLKTLLGRHGLKIEKKFFTWGPFMRLLVKK